MCNELKKEIEQTGYCCSAWKSADAVRPYLHKAIKEQNLRAEQNNNTNVAAITSLLILFPIQKGIDTHTTYSSKK